MNANTPDISSLNYDQASENDLEKMTTQLGRPVRGVVAIAARLVDGTPAVPFTLPRLPDGTPFPTSYYLTEPLLTAAASRLEAEGFMGTQQAELETNALLAEKYRDAHLSYLADRALLGQVPEVEGISAGGMPSRVKCLHAVVAHSLAKGPGVNPMGDWAIALMPASVTDLLPERYEIPPEVTSSQDGTGTHKNDPMA